MLFVDGHSSVKKPVVPEVKFSYIYTIEVQKYKFVYILTGMELIAAAILLAEEANMFRNSEARMERRRLRDSCNPFEMPDKM